MCCSSDSANPVSRGLSRMLSAVKWVLRDFALRHLVWIKLVFLFQSASMTVLYPYLNLHMKSLGISVREAALINAVVPVLFIFTPPLAGFLADRLGNFRVSHRAYKLCRATPLQCLVGAGTQCPP